MRLAALVIYMLAMSCMGEDNVSKRNVKAQFLRLISDPNSPSKGVGRLEVKLNGEWGPICDVGWTFQDAEVACEELGFVKAIYEAKASKHGSTSAESIISGVNCTEGDKKIVQCDRSDTVPGSCTQKRQAGVTCLEEGLPQILEVGCYRDVAATRVMNHMFANFRGDIDWWNIRSMVTRCAEAAKESGYNYFGIQFYGECWGSKDAHITFDDAGKAYNCINGVGRHFANFVYRFAPWKDLGCWTDQSSGRTMTLIANFRRSIQWTDMYKTVERCYDAATKKGYKYFAVQYYGECWASNDEESYKKYGQSIKCWGGTGRQLTNYVYEALY